MSNRKQTVAVIFGGRSVEHDVSIVTGQQIMKALNPAKYEILAIYITRDGKWFTGEPLKDIANFKDDKISQHAEVKPVLLSPDVRHHGFIIDPLPTGFMKKPTVVKVDVLFPSVHGSHGEDGTLQGLFELADIPYVGFATLGSALTNDKIMTKQILRQNNIAVVDDVWFTRAEWQNHRETVLARIDATFGESYPLFVKPATLGSSIGVSRVNTAPIAPFIDMATGFDRRVMVEKAVTDCVEINCSVIGYGDDVRASVLEQPITYADFLAFEDKYLSGKEGMKSADRIIPALLSDELTQKIQAIAIASFKAVDGRGMVRIDFLVRPQTGEIFVNELNTLPGSFSFYLWRPTGISESELIDKEIQYAREAHAEKRKNVYDYKTSLLGVVATRGIKGAKGSKGNKF
jgi:D-alanine-D-alanine ligase